MSTPLFGFDLIQKKNLRLFLLTAFETGEIPYPLPTVQHLTVVEGDTKEVTPSSNHTTVVVQDGAGVTDLTLVFPDNSVTRIGQIILIATLISVDNLVLSGPTILNAPGALLANDNAGFQKIEENLWLRII